MADLFWAGAEGELEVRRDGGGGTRLRGSFPYGVPAVLSDGGRSGRPKKEIIGPHAFAFRVNHPEKQIHLLAGHSWDRPLASKLADTLTLRDTADALSFDALITPEIAETSHGRDALALITAGLSTGISPGFRMPPDRAVPRVEAETITQEPNNPDQGQHAAIIRTVNEALLYELSLVTRPAYHQAQIEARCWTPGDVGFHETQRTLKRWRL